MKSPGTPESAEAIATEHLRERGDISLRLGKCMLENGKHVFEVLFRSQEELLEDPIVGSLSVDIEDDAVQLCLTDDADDADAPLKAAFL